MLLLTHLRQYWSFPILFVIPGPSFESLVLKKERKLVKMDIVILALDSVFVLTRRIIMHKIGLQTIPKTIFPFATNNLSETIIVSATIMRHFGKLSFNFTTTNWSYRRRQQLKYKIFIGGLIGLLLIESKQDWDNFLSSLNQQALLDAQLPP